MFATEGAAHRPEPTADLDQPQLSVVAMFVTALGTITPPAGCRDALPSPVQLVGTDGQAPARGRPAPTAVPDRGSAPVVSRFRPAGGRVGLLPLTAA